MKTNSISSLTILLTFWRLQIWLYRLLFIGGQSFILRFFPYFSWSPWFPCSSFRTCSRAFITGFNLHSFFVFILTKSVYWALRFAHYTAGIFSSEFTLSVPYSMPDFYATTQFRPTFALISLYSLSSCDSFCFWTLPIQSGNYLGLLGNLYRPIFSSLIVSIASFLCFSILDLPLNLKPRLNIV